MTCTLIEFAPSN